MKRISTLTTRRVIQALDSEFTRAYSDSAGALPRRDWTRPNSNNSRNSAPSQGRPRPAASAPAWDFPTNRSTRPGTGTGAGPTQDRRAGRWQPQNQGQSQSRSQNQNQNRNQRGPAWPGFPEFGLAGRGGRPGLAGASPYRRPPAETAPEERQQRSQQQPQQQQQQQPKVRPPLRSWAVSVPTPGLEDEKDTGARRRDRVRERDWDSRAALEEAAALEAEAEAIRWKKAQQKVKLIEMEDTSKDVYIPSAISVSNLARLLNIRIGRLQNKMYAAGMEDTAHDHVLTSDDASLIALEFGFNPVVDEDAAFDIYPEHPHPNPSSLPLRPPIVTIMGHVDHGKTTLLDTLRSASVAAGEAGGITQHIGAFSVPIKNPSDSTTAPRTVTFLDTPGHAAFSAMRARGADVTDIVVLVVAADDGVMPQTKEVIELTRRGGPDGESRVQLVVAINKCDKPGIDTDKVKRALLAEGVQLEEFGGDIPAVEVSGLTGAGLDMLIETLSALAEMAELRAEVDLRAHGRVLESRIDKGRGPVATVLVQRGSLKAGSSLVAGTAWARVRQMTDDKGRPVKVAKPGDAVTVAGWKDVPAAGDEVLQAEKEDDAKRAVENRKRVLESRALVQDVERINEKRKMDKALEEQERSAAEAAEAGISAPETTQPAPTEPEFKELKLIIKGDVSGSIEAVAGALCGIGNKIARVKIVSQSVGDVSESDITRAKAIDGKSYFISFCDSCANLATGMVVGFNVNAPSKIQQLAAIQGVPLLTENIIYKLMDEIKQRVIGLLPVTYEHRVLGEATVQEIFSIALKGRNTMNIAGCRVVNGVITKHAKVRVMREGVEVYNGSIDTFKQLKKDVTEMHKGGECGMSFTKFQDLKAGDRIQTYEVIEKAGVL
ncbi:Translation initiation factor IF-2 [Ceratobasidium theobromae]|uniref:Translation initiation factor IF-2, mitochondrial n=1 Tax=Ceratobasidium theobromae TaxID=1582974 RepID=A0A5N5QWH5_9AGAM|nr:Translation initiation factor IF-2 [Ceratobasidium theobromae]